MEQNKGTQNTKKKKRGVKPVRKPYLKGNTYSLFALKRSGRVFLLYFAFMFFFLLIGASLSFDNAVLNLILNAGAVVATVGMVYMDGLRHGDTDVSVGEIVYLRKESNREIDPEDMNRSYHPVKGILTALVGVSPFLLMALVHALCAEPQHYTLGMLPGWVGSVTAEEVQLPLDYYNREYAFTLVDLVRILSRLSLMPYVNIVTTDNVQGLFLVDRLSPILIALPAIGYVAGYLRGPVSRAYTHGNIAANTRRHKRKQMKERKARQSQNKQII
ncbi:MAG: hypothetical protein E7326_07230 [Clostridiales bacterium]|nr:hypothetical protein [Clostridiales bacterium]